MCVRGMLLDALFVAWLMANLFLAEPHECRTPDESKVRLECTIRVNATARQQQQGGGVSMREVQECVHQEFVGRARECAAHRQREQEKKEAEEEERRVEDERREERLRMWKQLVLDPLNDSAPSFLDIYSVEFKKHPAKLGRPFERDAFSFMVGDAVAILFRMCKFAIEGARSGSAFVIGSS